jgi:hypothetical protein
MRPSRAKNHGGSNRRFPNSQGCTRIDEGSERGRDQENPRCCQSLALDCLSGPG